MAKGCRSWYWHLGITSLLTLGGAMADFKNCSLAQITPDNTLGAESSVVTPNVNINALPSDQIDGGAKRGANLFHSFREFNIIDEGRGAYFSSPNGIQNILTRVTGGNPSNILGTLGVRGGSANLFLINPNGIIFGPASSLDIRGSFVGTTANAIGLGNRDIFSANPVEPLPTRLLNVNPSAFFFNQIAAGSIINRSIANSTGLRVPQSQSLLMVGGDVRLEGGRLRASRGRVELGGLASSGSVGLSINGSLMSLSFPDGVARADVSLTNTASVNVAASNGGSIAITAGNIDISGGSELLGGIERNMGFPEATAGDITLNAIEAINVANSNISTDVRDRAVGNGGNIHVTTGSLLMTNGAQLLASTWGKGNAGSVTIIARDQASFDGITSRNRVNPSSGAFSRVEPGAEGNGGNINVTTSSLYVSNGAKFSTSTDGRGHGGSVNIIARDQVSFDGTARNQASSYSSGVFSRVEPGAVGNAGNIEINVTAGSFSATNGAHLNVGTAGKGNGGSVTIDVRDQVSFDGTTIPNSNNPSGAFSPVELKAEGHGGNINVTAGSLFMTNGAQLQASTWGKGNAGSVTIDVHDQVSFDGTTSRNRVNPSSGAFSRVESEAEGNGGNIKVTTGSLDVSNGAKFSTSTAGRGNGGSVTIIAREQVSFDGTARNSNISSTQESSPSSGAFSRVEPGALGNGGDINVTAGSFFATGGAHLNVGTAGKGNGGSVNIIAREQVSFDGIARNQQLNTEQPSGVFSSAVGTDEGNGGNINITTGSLSVTDSAQVSVSSRKKLGSAGVLRVEANSIFLDRGELRALTLYSSGGNINLQVQDLILMRQMSSISAEAGNTGNGGNIRINTPLLVASPKGNSDIIATAVRGQGGNVNITTRGIFGLQRRALQTSESDISASSDFGVDGVVEINTPDVDSSRGLVTLPAELVNASGLIAQTCPAGRGQGQSEFIVTGRGGLPPNSSEALSSEPVQVDWVTLNPRVETAKSPTVLTNLTTLAPAPLVEAQGWVTNNKGQVVLTAQAPTVILYIPWLPSTNCPALETSS